jgi:hypothetical protein
MYDNAYVQFAHCVCYAQHICKVGEAEQLVCLEAVGPPLGRSSHLDDDYTWELTCSYIVLCYDLLAIKQVTQALEVCETELKALHESYVEMLAAYEVASSGILPSGYASILVSYIAFYSCYICVTCICVTCTVLTTLACCYSLILYAYSLLLLNGLSCLAYNKHLYAGDHHRCHQELDLDHLHVVAVDDNHHVHQGHVAGINKHTVASWCV